jgi:agmatinase
MTMQPGSPDGRSDGWRLNAPFVGIPTFLRSAVVTDLDALDADIAIMGVPTDEGSPFMPGSRFGARAIREQSLRFGAGGRGYWDPTLRRRFLEHEAANGRIVDVGDADVLPTNVEQTFANITAMTRALLDRGAMPVALGGDHAISFPIVRAFDEDIHVVHFDAHMDYVPFFHGMTMTNGTSMRQAAMLPQVKSITEIGIRSLRVMEEEALDARKDGTRVVTMEEYLDLGIRGLVDSLPRDAKVYVTIDIDVLDMSLIPGCLSGEPNGMSYAMLRDTLGALAEQVEIAAFDLAEVNPLLDVKTNPTSYLAAHTVLEFLGRICDQPRWISKRDARADKRAKAAQQG